MIIISLACYNGYKVATGGEMVSSVRNLERANSYLLI
jgi:hypothetical protein